jgi:hypothetical protein
VIALLVRTVLLLSALAVASACSIQSEPGGVIERTLLFLSDGGKPSRGRVITDFMEDADAAARKYTPYWAAETARPVDLGDRRRETLVALAGELLNEDPNSYQDYLRFIVESTHSPSRDVVDASVWALGRASDAESARLLVSFLGDPRPRLAEAAFQSIINRRYDDNFDASRRGDLAAIDAAVAEFCSRRPATPSATRACAVGFESVAADQRASR